MSPRQRSGDLASQASAPYRRLSRHLDTSGSAQGDAHDPALDHWDLGVSLDDEPARVPPFVLQPPPRQGPRRAIRLGTALIVAAALVAAMVLFVPGNEGVLDQTPTPAEGEQVIALITPEPEEPAAGTPDPVDQAEEVVEPTQTPDPRFAGTVICLDVGHGGSDRGYTREANEVAPAMEEAVLNLNHAVELQRRLEQRGFTIVLTRTEDTDVNHELADVNEDGFTRDDGVDFFQMREYGNLDELQARIDICNRANADLLLSMHINGYPDPTVSGFETWYSSARPFAAFSRLLAALVHEELGAQLRAAGYDATGRGVKDDSVWTDENENDPHVRENYIVLGPKQDGVREPSAMPGALLEALFISNDEDARILNSPEGENAIVTAYEQAILRYFDQTRR